MQRFFRGITASKNKIIFVNDSKFVRTSLVTLTKFEASRHPTGLQIKMEFATASVNATCYTDPTFLTAKMYGTRVVELQLNIVFIVVTNFRLKAFI